MACEEQVNVGSQSLEEGSYNRTWEVCDYFRFPYEDDGLVLKMGLMRRSSLGRSTSTSRSGPILNPPVARERPSRLSLVHFIWQFFTIQNDSPHPPPPSKDFGEWRTLRKRFISPVASHLSASQVLHSPQSPMTHFLLSKVLKWACRLSLLMPAFCTAMQHIKATPKRNW